MSVLLSEKSATSSSNRLKGDLGIRVAAGVITARSAAAADAGEGGLVDVGALERVVEHVAAQQALVGDLLADHRAAVEFGGLYLAVDMSQLKTVLAA